MIVGVVISNILYLGGAIVVAAIGALVVVLRHRKPKSVEANVASFHRGLRALAPDQPTGSPETGPSWGGASRRAATTPAAFKRSATPSADAPEDLPPVPADEQLSEDATDAGPDAEEDVDDEAVPGDPGSEGYEANPPVGDPAEPPAAVDPVHMTSRKRRPSSGSATRASDESEVSTEEAGTG